MHPALSPANVAVVTGGASGIGLAAAKRLASRGLRVAIADLAGPRLQEATASVAAVCPGGAKDILGVPTDVGAVEDVRRLEAAVRAAFGRIDVLVNNAGIQPGSAMFGPTAAWESVLRVNLMGIIHVAQILTPGLIAQGTPGLVINTGSKQGITTPPGDPAYNVAKAGVKAFTEALQHELRNIAGCQVSAHLFIPGFVFTPLTSKGRSDKPAAAWTPEQTVDFMLARVEAGDFYILCPDNDAPRSLDEKRILWAVGDIVENRPPLSRWHPDFADKFKQFIG